MTDIRKRIKSLFLLRGHSILRKRLIIAVFVILFAVGILSGWVYMNNQNTVKNAKSNEAADLQDTRSEAVEQTSNGADKLVNTGKTEEAIKLYDSAVKSSDDSYSKSSLLLDKAAIYFNEGNYDEALKIANEVVTIEESAVAYQFIAQIYEQKNDKDNAIKYYQKAVLLVDKTDPLSDEDIQYYKSKIDELGGVSK